jgi:histidyl-tRNA synthetase
MFRHERPQRGRQRQFHQIGAEAFGMADPGIDAELIMLTWRLWNMLGLADDLVLRINTLGHRDERERYREQLRAWLAERADRLDEDCRRRMDSNPLRVFDSKNPDMQALLADAPLLTGQLGEASRTHFDTVCALLRERGIEPRIDPRLVRGLDYYSHTVFEWETDALGAQGTVCAGGRYDDLVAMHGAKPTPGVGFAMGEERLVELLDRVPVDDASPLLYVTVQDPALRGAALLLLERCRDAVPGASMQFDHLGGSLRAQLKRADRSGSRLALIVGGDEFAAGEVTVRPMRRDAAQHTVALDDLPGWLAGQAD